MKDNGVLTNEADSVKIVQTTQNLTAGALNYTTAFADSVRILEIEIHFEAAVTETVNITKVFATTTYNTLRKTQALTTATDFVYTDVIYLDKNSKLNIACTNGTATTNARVTITYSTLAR
jgi:hypothetical protein